MLCLKNQVIMNRDFIFQTPQAVPYRKSGTACVILYRGMIWILQMLSVK